MSGRCCAMLLCIVAFVSVACGGDDGPQVDDDPGPGHVHGLGINPADGALFVATHFGLYRIEAAGDEPQRVGDLLQDTMGFTVVGPDAFLGSGHPDLEQMREEDLPPNLGLIASTDAGESWEQRSLLGEADFHVLRSAGRRVVGYDSTHQRLLASSDEGATWRERPLPEPLLDLVLRPGDPSQMVASGESGVYASQDDAASWSVLEGQPGLLSWPALDALFLVDAAGGVARSRDGGRTWSAVGRVPGEPAAVHAESGDVVYVALHNGAITWSRDGGATFAQFAPASAPAG